MTKENTSLLYLSQFFGDHLEKEVDDRIQMCKDEIVNLRRRIDNAEVLRMSDKNNNEGHWHKEAYIQRQNDYIKVYEKALLRTRDEWKDEIISEWRRAENWDASHDRDFIKKMQLWKKLHSAWYEVTRDEALLRTRTDEIPFRLGDINDELKRVGNVNIWWFDELDVPKRAEDFTYIDEKIIKSVTRYLKDKLNEKSFGKIQRDLDKADEKAEYRTELVDLLEGLVLNLYFIKKRREGIVEIEWDEFYKSCYRIYCWVCVWVVLDAGSLKGKKLIGTDDGIIKELSFSKLWLDVAKRWSGISAENLESVAREWKYIKKSEGWRYPEGWNKEDKAEWRNENGIERKKHKERKDKGQKRGLNNENIELIGKIVRWMRNENIEEYSKIKLAEIFQTNRVTLTKILNIIIDNKITYKNYKRILSNIM